MSQLEIRTGQLIREVARMHVQLQRASAECCGGTTMTQCTILTEIGRNGPGTLIELSRRLDLDKSWLSRAVENLVQDGFLEKVVNPEDRRTVNISLSQAGQQRYRELNQTLNDQAERVMDHVPMAERENVARALQLLLGALQAESSAQAQSPASCATVSM